VKDRPQKFFSTGSLFSLVLMLRLIAGATALHAGTPAGKSQKLASPDQVVEALAKSDWQSSRAAYESGRHAFQPIKGGRQARNPGQQRTTKFDRGGFLTRRRDGGRPDCMAMDKVENAEERVADFGEEDDPQDGNVMASTSMENPMAGGETFFASHTNFSLESLSSLLPLERGPPSPAPLRRAAASSGDGLLAGFSNPQSQGYS
jgi:hypothetical protein